MGQVPPGLAQRGTRLWAWATASFELSVVELEVLTEACRCLDLCDALAGSPTNAREVRLQRETFARLVDRLNFPEDVAPAAPATVRARKAAAARWEGHTKRGKAT